MDPSPFSVILATLRSAKDSCASLLDPALEPRAREHAQQALELLGSLQHALLGIREELFEGRVRIRELEARLASVVSTRSTGVKALEAGRTGPVITVQQLIDAMQEGVIVTDPEGRIEAVNDAFCRVTGYGREEAVGNNPRMLQSGCQGPDFYQVMWNALRAMGRWQGEIWDRRKNGEIYPEWLSIGILRDENGRAIRFVGVFTDITDRKISEVRLVCQAHTDAVTGLPNSLLLRDRLGQAMVRARRDGSSVAVLFMDLDGFKPVNDSFGHAAGDLLLQIIADRLKACVREDDTVSRVGDDEFVLVLNQATKEGAAVTARKVLEAVAAPCDLVGRHASVTASLGVALYPAHGAEGEFLLKRADAAMYRAKQESRNAFRFYDVGA